MSTSAVGRANPCSVSAIPPITPYSISASSRRRAVRVIVSHTRSVFMKKPSISWASSSAVAPMRIFAIALSYARVDHLPAHHRVPHLRREQLRLRCGVEIAFDDCQVGELARFDRAARGLFECGVRGIRGETADRLGERQLLVGVPAAGGIAFLVLARDGAVDA